MADPFATVAPEKREMALRFDKIFQEVSGFSPRLWGKVIGYGRYHYKTKAGTEGDCFATGFHMRARDISVHILPGYTEFPEIAARLGPHRRGKSCWYIKSLDVVDEAALRDLIRAGLDDLAASEVVLPN